MRRVGKGRGRREGAGLGGAPPIGARLPAPRANGRAAGPEAARSRAPGAAAGMRRWAPAWPGELKVRAARYVLERTLGPFLEERLRLEQLSLDLRGGTGELRDLRLRASALDAVLAAAGCPLELRGGQVGAVAVAVPWGALGSRPCCLRLRGLRLTLRPRECRGGGAFGVSPSPLGSLSLFWGPHPDPGVLLSPFGVPRSPGGP
ncbi:autophagy-related protein 2 homolog A-like [Anser cygnoides]|uniref:autophagy-related protein 2 homolog A-like n=1 Tax=Anser cygnoides TaxID=8845 RepID=UPI0034D28EF4